MKLWNTEVKSGKEKELVHIHLRPSQLQEFLAPSAVKRGTFLVSGETWKL